jgi:hypothetical protein
LTFAYEPPKTLGSLYLLKVPLAPKHAAVFPNTSAVLLTTAATAFTTGAATDVTTATAFEQQLNLSPVHEPNRLSETFFHFFRVYF